MELEKQRSRSKRIFVNNVDEYSSNNIAKFLSTCQASETSEGEEETSFSDEPAFHVVGTVSSSSRETSGFLREQYMSPTREELFKCLLECDVVVYNISETITNQQVEEATWAVTALHAEMKKFKSQKMFILVSTVMTWTMTIIENLGDKDGVLSDGDFRQRRPHPTFRNHNELEKLMLKLTKEKKSKLKAYVIAAGVQYGMGENLFHYFFKTSWLMQVPEVPIFGEGTNYIPMIHVHDLGGVIKNTIEQRPKSKYILAVDDSKNTLEDIVKIISEVLGPGMVCKLSEKEAITMKAFKPEELDCLSVNLRMDAFVVKVSLNPSWKSKAGMIENIESIVREYKEIRQLLPVRICLVGPPAVGKTTVAEKLCQHYKIHHIRIKEMIEEKISQLNEMISGADPEHVSEEALAAACKQLENINNSMKMNQGQLPEPEVYAILQEKLNSQSCRNQGFVLDGFPETYKQAELSFSEDGIEDRESDLKFKLPGYNKTISPEHVFVLDAPDDLLIKRVQALPESTAEELQCTQDKFMSRLNNYRQLRGAEETALDFFDHREIHPEHIEVSADDPMYSNVMKMITEVVGVPKNYGLSPEEQEEEDRKRECEKRQKLAAEAIERKRRKEDALAEMAAQYEEWNKNLSEVKQQVCELQEAQCLPLRTYLMKYVMPSLTDAMVQSCKIKPEDPVDFLAEYLLRTTNQKDDPQ